MDRILCGIETEYGMAVSGRGAEDQIEDATALVRSYPGERLAFKWDYSLESPRADLRGFRLDRLAVDPTDARFDAGRPSLPSEEIRSDLVLPNGARLYNDHGHPEYATQECWGVRELAIADKAGELAILRAAEVFAKERNLQVKIYKNNTDFHGASYGTHESYLAPRRLGFDGLFGALLPMLIARQVLTGAGKAGVEKGDFVPFQMSQRADFFAEAANAETLYRRPIFNTRDEPHADPREWIRVHVISGDANMMAGCTARKAGLVKLALMLASAGEAPVWRIQRPVEVFQSISRGPLAEGKIDLEGGGWTTPRHVLESYLSAAQKVFDLDPELDEIVEECEALLECRFADPVKFSQSVDWAAKMTILDQYREAEGLDWKAPMMQSLDLAYTDVDADEGLFHALVEAGMVEAQPSSAEMEARLTAACEPTRALARGAAVSQFGNLVTSISWSSIRFGSGDETVECYLDPTQLFSEDLLTSATPKDFKEALSQP